MTLQQLEYIVALDTHRRFSTAAAACHVSQPSLSALVQKLEDELGVKIFDRSRQPVAPTEIGQEIIAHARLVLLEANHLRELVRDHRENITGDFRLGIIPTLAPYLLPLFLKKFAEKHPLVSLSVSERTTEGLLRMLKENQLDAALLATPTGESGLSETPIFQEEFAAYAPHEPSVLKKRYLLAKDIDPNRLVLLEEGHCLRKQVINLCQLQKEQSRFRNIHYEAGSLETLRRLVEAHSGITILPQLALLDLDEDQMQNVRFFQPPAPVREISLVTRRTFSKVKLLHALRDVIVENLPQAVLGMKEGRVMGV
ncbi:MAG: LysR family transcriptional regulator [Saprospiraceae bacterium]|nr:LysR family transcriptional regulator [Saprospiraceae bacterium]